MYIRRTTIKSRRSGEPDYIYRLDETITLYDLTNTYFEGSERERHSRTVYQTL